MKSLISVAWSVLCSNDSWHDPMFFFSAGRTKGVLVHMSPNNMLYL